MKKVYVLDTNIPLLDPDCINKFEDNDVVVRIRDYGAGIPEDELPLVKKKFYKGRWLIRRIAKRTPS